MKIFSSYPGCHEFQSKLGKGRMCWYNILGDNYGIISHLLWVYTITSGSVYITLFLCKGEILRPF